MTQRGSGAGWTGLAVSLPLLLGGCSSVEGDCLEVCEAAASCPGPSLDTASCEAKCARLDSLASASDCQDQIEGYIDCAAGASDPCEPAASCGAQVMAYLGCARPHCDANPSADECRGLTCSYGSTGGAGNTCAVDAQCTGSPQFELECVDGSCTCKQDGADVASATFQESFCSGDLDTAVAAAIGACSWGF